MMDFEREFFSSMGKQEIHFEKGIVRAVEGGAVELALERTDVGCFDPSDKVGEEGALQKVLKRSENLSSVAWS